MSKQMIAHVYLFNYHYYFFLRGGGSPSPFQAPVVQNLDIAIYRINHQPQDKCQGNQFERNDDDDDDDDDDGDESNEGDEVYDDETG